MEEKKLTENEEIKEVIVENENPVVADEQPAAEPDPTVEPEDTPADSDNKDEEKKTPQSKADVLDILKEVAQNGGNIRRQDLEALKQAYHRYRTAEIAKEREDYLAGGGQEDTFIPTPDPDEQNFKAQYNLIREQRAKFAEEEESEKKQNLARKLEIIEQIKQAATSPDEADKNYELVKQLQAKWKEIKLVPAENATELWKNYQHHVEQFYDQLHLNYEARQYDFKKNLEIKLRLCEAVEKLANMDDVISAFHQLQNLHQQFRETGPVAKTEREAVWNRFKDASTVINKRHQAYFEEQKKAELENLEKKTALCEEIEQIDVDQISGRSEWEKFTKKIIDIQTRWRAIGFTPRKQNAEIFERFRAACDKFFQKKAAFFKEQRESFAANLRAKNELVQAAEELKDSTEWNKTTNKIIELQKRWKEIGPVAHKASETVWQRFNDACNYFFEKKNEATSGQRQEEAENLAKKLQIIADLEKLAEEKADDIAEKFHQLQDEWANTGHVPFRKKEKIYRQYREVCDKLYEEFHLSARRREVENFRKHVSEKSGSSLEREIARLQAAFEAKKEEIKNYETNLSFFSSKSKTGNSLVEEINKKIEHLKQDLQVLADKISAAQSQETTEQSADETAETEV
ncbi:MAG: DUF349 domain-containing protein [Alloprevotella sp.]|nr:DUF349 domain-containing protein [Alloprevotella sp.]